MKELPALRKQLSILTRQIQEVEEKNRVEIEEQQIEKHCVKVVCDTCNGTGEVMLGGADIISDPPYGEACDQCYGEGYLYARKFIERKSHVAVPRAIYTEAF